MVKKPTYEELEMQKNLFEVMLAATLDIFVLKDTNFIYQAVNTSFCKFIGKPSKDIIGKTCDLVSRLDQRISWKQMLLKQVTSIKI
jgi:PAS domain-containing protein